MHEVIGYILYMDFMNHFTGWFIILFSIILLIWHHILVKKTWVQMLGEYGVFCALRL